MPAGWSIAGGKPLSPWHTLGPKAWPNGATTPDVIVCCKSGRPALYAGKSIEFSVDQVIPKEVVPILNPYGDGQFRITVTNRADEATDVPALLSDDQTIFWAD